MRSRASAPRATALVVCLGVLMVLSALATSFVRVHWQERQAARNHVHQVTARFLAHAGIERALGEIRATIAGKGYLDGNESWVYRPGETSESIEDTRYPSLPHDRNRNGTIENGRDGTTEDDLVHGRMVSGVIERPAGRPGESWNAAHEPEGLTYTLRVVDTSSTIHLNSRQQNLPALLENLGLALSAGAFLNPVPPGMGAVIVAFRDSLPGGQFSDKRQLRQVLSPAAFEVLFDHVGVRAWVDRDTVRPRPLDQRRGRGGRPLAIGDPVHAVDELAPGTLETEPRAPVNVNAAPLAVLAAVFLRVTGFHVEEDLDLAAGTTDETLFFRWLATTCDFAGPVGRLGTLRESPAVTLDLALRLARECVERRRARPFAGWSDFNAFLAARTYLGEAQKWALLANCNPNTNLNDWNPPEAIWRAVDKTDLTSYTTELCFASGGRFVIQSLGRVTLLGGEVMARHLTTVELGAFDQLRETTQRQFMEEYVLLGTLDSTFSAATGGTLTVTGKSLQSFPEWHRRDFIALAHYDGHLALATVEADSSGLPPTMLYASLSTGFQAGQPGIVSAAIPDRAGPVMGALVPGDPAVHPGDLRPDGLYVERDSSLAYRVDGNWNVRHAAASLWLKPNWNPARTPRPHCIFSAARLSRSGPTTGRGNINPSPWGLWYLPPAIGGSADETGPYAYFPPLFRARGLTFAWAYDYKADDGGSGWLFAGALSPTLNHEGHTHAPVRDLLAAHRWVHVTAWWNWEAPPDSSPDEVVGMWINGVRVPVGNAFANAPFKTPISNNPDYRTHYDGTPNTFRLGEYAAMPSFNFPADCTVDEIRMYMAPPVAERGTALDYQRGRYYKGAGTFYSRPVQFGRQETIGRAYWTHYIPASQPNATVTVRVYDTRGTDARDDDLLLAESSSPDGAMAVGKPALGVRYEVTLAANTGSAPVLESPIFDDITITRWAGMRALAWTDE